MRNFPKVELSWEGGNSPTKIHFRAGIFQWSKFLEGNFPREIFWRGLFRGIRLEESFTVNVFHYSITLPQRCCPLMRIVRVVGKIGAFKYTSIRVTIIFCSSDSARIDTPITIYFAHS